MQTCRLNRTIVELKHHRARIARFDSDRLESNHRGIETFEGEGGVAMQEKA